MRCQHCGRWREYGCRWDCPDKQPPVVGGVSYQVWAQEQQQAIAEAQAKHCVKCPAWIEEMKGRTS